MSVVRPIRVTLALAAAGAVLGALAGIVVAMLLVGALIGPDALLELAAGYSMAARLGAVCGAVLAPIASLTFMRRVPLWRLFAETTLGAVIGGALGLILPVDLPAAVVVVGMATLGFVLAGARLSRAFCTSDSSAPSPMLANETLQLTARPASGCAPGEPILREGAQRLDGRRAAAELER